MANFNFNKVIIGGRLTADPELKTTPSGISVTTFSVAVNRNFKGPDGKQLVDFLNVTAWRGTAEFITRYFRKASSICVVGSVQTRSWTDQNGQKRFATEIVADEAFFVDGKNDGPGMRGGQQGDITVTEDCPALAGGSGSAKAAPQAFSTPGARGQFEEIEDDGELPF